jgi:hypothetical protein
LVFGTFDPLGEANAHEDFGDLVGSVEAAPRFLGFEPELVNPGQGG